MEPLLICLICSLVCSLCLEQCLTYSRWSMNICRINQWTNEWMSNLGQPSSDARWRSHNVITVRSEHVSQLHWSVQTKHQTVISVVQRGTQEVSRVHTAKFSRAWEWSSPNTQQIPELTPTSTKQLATTISYLSNVMYQAYSHPAPSGMSGRSWRPNPGITDRSAKAYPATSPPWWPACNVGSADLPHTWLRKASLGVLGSRTL